MLLEEGMRLDWATRLVENLYFFLFQIQQIKLEPIFIVSKKQDEQKPWILVGIWNKYRICYWLVGTMFLLYSRRPA